MDNIQYSFQPSTKGIYSTSTFNNDDTTKPHSHSDNLSFLSIDTSKKLQSIEQLYKLKARLLHYVEETGNRLQEYQLQQPKLLRTQDEVKNFKNEIAALNTTIQTLQFRLQEQSKNKQDHNNNNNNNDTSNNMSPASASSLSSSTLTTEQQYKAQIDKLQQQVELLKNDNIEQRDALLKCNLNYEKEKHEKILLQSKYSHLQNKYTKLDEQMNSHVFDSMRNSVQRHLCTYQSLTVDFEQFLSTYQSTLLNRREEYNTLHNNIAQLQQLVDSKSAELVLAQSQLFQRSERMTEFEHKCVKLDRENHLLNSKYASLLTEHGNKMKTLQTSIGLYVDANKLSTALDMFSTPDFNMELSSLPQEQQRQQTSAQQQPISSPLLTSTTL